MNEAIEIGGVFVGIGIMTVLLVVAYWLYQLGRMYKYTVDKEEKYEFVEGMAIEKTALKKGFDMAAVKDALIAKKSKSFRKVIQEEMIKDFLESKKQK